MTTGELSRRGLALSALVAILIWVALDRASWYTRARGAEYFAALGALATATTAIVSALAALGVLVYVVLTYRLWEQSRQANAASRRTNEAAIMSELMTGYDSLRDDVRALQDFFRRFPDHAEAIEAFRRARSADDQNSHEMQTVDPARFRISRFFVRVRKLARAGYVSRRIVFLSLNREPIEDVFLLLVDPLDEVISVAARGRASLADRAFYTQLLADRDSLDIEEVNDRGAR
jgi:hypothetical protein